MRDCREISDDSFADRFGELARSRCDAIEQDFPDERLKREFGLNMKESIFVKTYCATFKKVSSALYAGYSEKTANSLSWNFFGSAKIEAAINAILKCVSSATKMQRLILAEKCVDKLSSIIDDCKEKGAVKVSAIEALRKFIEDPPIKVQDDERQVDDVSDDEIKASLKRSGMPYD